MFNFEPFLGDLDALKKASPQTIRSYRHDLRLFEDFARQRLVSEPGQISHTVIREYVTYMREKVNPRTGKAGLADTSIARRLAALSSFLEYTRATGDHNLRNPLKEVKGKWQRNSKPNPVDEYDIDMLLASISDSRDRVLFSLLLASGLRISEVRQLNRDSIQLSVERQPNGKLRALGSGEVVGKGGKRRAFYVDDQTLRAYTRYLKTRKDNDPALFISSRNQRMSVRAIQERLGHWCKVVGFKHINVHRLRHTYATRLANNNIDSIVLKDLMGHSSFATTQKYFKLSDSTLARGYFAAMERATK
ncbi:MAG TPA: tyrosine-type recombinase/integrase [Terracidiphilus sp.]|jgi:site-specific recombinase XerD